MPLNKNLISKVQSPTLPVSPAKPERLFFDDLNNTLRLFFNRLVSNLNFLTGTAGARFVDFPNGLFYHITDQPLDTMDVGQPVEFSEMYLSSGVEVVGVADNEITVQYGGIYGFQFSAQLHSHSGTSKVAYIWIVKNGAAVNWTAKKYTVAGAGKNVEVTWDFNIALLAEDVLELHWTGDDIDLSLEAVASAGAQPGVPSAVVSVTYISPLPDPLPTPP